MKLRDALKAIEQSNRGGAYYVKGSLTEVVILGILFGLAVSFHHYINNPLYSFLAFIPVISLPILFPNKFKGFKRCIIFAPANTDIRYSTLIFSLFYFILLSSVVALVMYISNFYVKP